MESENTLSFIDSNAVYDTRPLKNVGNYVELSFMLSNRDNYRSYLKIDDYLQDIKIYGLNSSKSKTVLYDSNAQNDAAQTVTSDGNVPAVYGKIEMQKKGSKSA